MLHSLLLELTILPKEKEKGKRKTKGFLVMNVLNLKTCPTVHPKTPPIRNKLYNWYVDEINHRLSAKVWANAMFKEAMRQSFFNKLLRPHQGH